MNIFNYFKDKVSCESSLIDIDPYYDKSDIELIVHKFLYLNKNNEICNIQKKNFDEIGIDLESFISLIKKVNIDNIITKALD
jgi:hypothetical protein